MKIRKYLLALSALLSFPLVTSCSHDKTSTYDVHDFGAVGDGKHVDSPAINAAIAQASADGGGTVVLPVGTYLSYSIRLQSHVTLRLDSGAVLLAALPNDSLGYDEAEEYDHKYYQDFGHSHFRNSLIWGDSLTHIAITGRGRIVGSAMNSHQERPSAQPSANKAIALRACENVRLSGIEMLECGHFALLATGVDHLTIDSLTIDTNRDGLDIDCCRNVQITHCRVNTPNDDAIVIKSSYALGEFHDCEDIEVAYCDVSGYDLGTMLDGTYTLVGPNAPDRGGRTGRIKLGTESSGGYRRVSIHDCTFTHCRGLALETVDGGILEDVTCSNLTMDHIVNAAIFLRLGARMRSPEGTPVGQLRRVHIEHIKARDVDSRYSSIIAGIPGHPIEDISLSDIDIEYRGGCRLTDQIPVVAKAPWERPGYREPQRKDQMTEEEKAERRRMMEEWRNTERDTALICNLNYQIPEEEAGYPEPWIFGIVPAKGLFLRHVRNLTLNNVRFSYQQDDARPLFKEEDCENIINN